MGRGKTSSKGRTGQNPNSKKGLNVEAAMKALSQQRTAALQRQIRYQEQAEHRQALQLASILTEVAKRRAEALNLYEPLAIAEEIHSCELPERLVRGSNQSGKTLMTMVEVARAVTGTDPYCKYPLANGVLILAGLNATFLAEVFYKKLFRAGAFDIIRDELTGLWRNYRPWTDLHRAGEKKPAPPLIPQRWIKDESWEHKAARVPHMFRLINGWEMYFISGNSAAPRGWIVDFAVCSEEIENSELYPELAARLLARKGKFIWDACPQSATLHLDLMHERAERGDPYVKEVHVTLESNPYIPESEKKILFSKWTESERIVRYFGEFASAGLLVYPEWAEEVHGIDWFEIPSDWTHVAAIDPGHQVSAALLLAVPPDEGHVVVYDELYIKQCTSELFGEEFAARTAHKAFHAFIIDSRMARVHEMGSGRSVGSQYAEALAKWKVSCTTTGCDFTWGSDDLKGGLEAVRGWLRVRGSGTPYLRVMRNRCPHLREEFKKHRNKKDQHGNPTDEPDIRSKHDVLDALRYLAMYNPTYVPPPKVKKPLSPAALAMKAKRERPANPDGSFLGFVNLGPPLR
jgi:hypothetical protein